LLYIFVLGTLYQLQTRIVREQDFVVLTSQNPSLQVL
jgi:hypothetical protein